MTVRDVLLKAAELCERGWCQKRLAERDDGRWCWPDDKRAERWCVLGALWRAAGSEQQSIPIAQALVRDLGIDSAADWNNAPGRTQAEVVSALRRAAEQAGER